MAQDKQNPESDQAGHREESLASSPQVASEMAKAFQELARGEQTASALEQKLDGIESRIEELLAAAEAAANVQKEQTTGEGEEQG